jgi:hypothetical protein
MAGRKVLVLEMRVRHLPPEPIKRRYQMARAVLRLVVADGDHSGDSTETGRRSVHGLADRVRESTVTDSIAGEVDVPPDDAA